MINTLLIAAVLLAGVVAGVFLALYLAWRIVSRRIQAAAIKFLAPPAPGEASEFAKVVDMIAGILGAQVAAHLKAVFLGLQSVESKNERRQAAAGLMAGNSLLAALAASFPALGKKMLNNPALASLASLAINKATAPRTDTAPAPASGDGVPVKFDF